MIKGAIVRAKEAKDGQRVVLRDKDGDRYGAIIGDIFMVPTGNREETWQEAVWVKWDDTETRVCLVSILEALNDNPYSGLITEIAERVIERALISCPHPNLTIHHNAMRLETDIYCPDCGKRISIYDRTVERVSQSELAGIVGIAFGEHWKQTLEKAGKA